MDTAADSHPSGSFGVSCAACTLVAFILMHCSAAQALPEHAQHVEVDPAVRGDAAAGYHHNDPIEHL